MPARRLRVFHAVLSMSSLLAVPAGAAPDRGAVRGTAGFAPLPFAARNDSGGAMRCGVATAHWYSVDLGTAVPGARLRQRFWVAPATGEVVILNVQGDRMPVETLWCGRAGRAWETRAVIGLERRAHRRPAPLRVACRDDGAALRCTTLSLGPSR